jgi:hypothetical protein
VEYNYTLIVDWLAACVALRVVGTVQVVLFRRWRKICTFLQPMGSNGRYLTKCLKPCWPIRSKETWTEYIPLTLLSQHFLRYKNHWSLEHLKNLKNWPRPLIRPRTDHAWHQKPNPSRETVPLTSFKELLTSLDKHVISFIFEWNVV